MSDLYQMPLKALKGIRRPKIAELEGLGIRSIGDLLEYYPFRYEDYRLRSLTEVKDGEKITVQAKVAGEPVLQMYGRSKSRLSCRLMIDGLLVTSVWFNRHFMKERLRPGAELIVTGKWDGRRMQMTVSEAEFPGSTTSRSGTLQPVYSIGGSITQNWLRKQISVALSQFGELIEEVLPEELIQKYRLMPRNEAVYHVHHPEHTKDGQLARTRLVYEELFLFQLKLQAYKATQRDRTDGIAHRFDMEEVRSFVRGLPFKLTNSQKQVIAEILQDLQAPFSMNRLLQGDVGAGKTVVAAVTLYASVRAGCQGALMVPTELLAEQHARSLTKLFEPYGLQIGLLTGSLTERKRRDVLSALQMGLIDIVVGTHALIQEDVFFRRLGVVVTDEQHRFGVNQRSILRRKGQHPDVLLMTATPIPRTLAITAFGDLDVSTLRELPKGRLPILTYWVRPEKLEGVIGMMRKEVGEGRQVYVICPLIEESEKLDVQNAIDAFVQLQQALHPIRVGLLHGRMPAAEKEQVMRQFSEAELDVLVSTTVIEVGVDVPNASLMVIYDADRFGLSQLHQLRGRVGRGANQSYCVLIADPKSEIAIERMRTMTDTNDGFEIARRDLELRGPGDVFGTKQSGMPDFRLADLSADFEWMELARDDAAALLGAADFWTAARYLPLRAYLQREQVPDGEVLD
ncbi:ATP-dependent DNA helicase RecG [Paenibacillus sp. y28]|uniref:ATP-dependent DNA helicase RecG n=1 Tax=Paenibacillus sp. y28 TaxID=3129110 RepID=UPI003017D4D1